MSHAVTALHALRDEGLRDAGEELAAVFAISATDLIAINAYAADNERWRKSVLRHLPCIDFTQATPRCSNGPWYPMQDIGVVVPRRPHVPSFTFDRDSSPASIWITLMHTLRTPASPSAGWDVLGCLLRPHPLLNVQPPIMMYKQMPA